jgi:transposase
VIPHGVEIYLGIEPIDLRWGFDRLCGVVSERIGRRPRSGAVFAFFGRRRSAMKVLYFDGTGLCIFYKRLDAGTFKLPLSHDGKSHTVVLSERELEDLFAGLDIELPTKH